MADDITADVLTYDGKTKVVTAKGDVVIHANQGATITGAQGGHHPFCRPHVSLSG